jgi:pimeloyl-ACP methyl ester carboxylesterase
MQRLVLIAALALVPLGSVCATAQSQTPLWKTMPGVSPMPKADRSGIAALNGIELYYAVFNERAGKPVILLHGGLGSSDQWGDEVPLLATTHEVIVVDSRGHGRSTLGSQPLSYELMASDVLGLMDRLKLAKSSIVGWSDGGIIGLMLAIHHPDRLDKLLTYGANFNNSDEPAGAPDPAAFARYKAMAEAQYREHSPTPNDFPKLVGALRDMYGREPNIAPAELGTITAQTVIADGQYEQFISRKHTETLARLIPGAKLVIIPDVSHGGPTQDPVRFHAAVANLIDGERRVP